MKRLRTDRIDLYLLHWTGSYPLMETVAGFEDLKRTGKILRWGVSNFDTSDLKDLEAVSRDCASNQILYNLTRRAAEKEVIPRCREQRIGVMAPTSMAKVVILRIWFKIRPISQ